MKRLTEPTGRNRSTRLDTAVGRRCRSIPAAPDSPGSPRRDRTGSALILTIVCLVMMVLLGTAYIQIARVDRRATRQLSEIVAIDTVRDAVISRISEELKRDVVSMEGATVGTLFDGNQHIETYDYPFTNNNVTRPVDSYLLTGTTWQVAGGEWDDPWLASNFPRFEGGSIKWPRWEHISNLEGVFLLMPSPTTGPALPKETPVLNQAGEYAVHIHSDGINKPSAAAGSSIFIGTDGGARGSGDGFNVGLHKDGIVAGYDKMGVDADGDGLPDARWTWAPEAVRQIGTLTYVAAYRIVDLSGLINLNVATSTSATTTAQAFVVDTVAPEDPRGYYPSDLGLRRFMGRGINGLVYADPGLRAVFNRRFNYPAAGAFPVPPGTYAFPPGSQYATTSGASMRSGAWLNDDGGSHPGARHFRKFDDPLNTFPYTVSDELELRSRGGLNTGNTTQLELDMPGLLRAQPSDPDESGYAYQNAVSGAAASTDVHQTAQIYRWFTGGQYPPDSLKAAQQPTADGFQTFDRQYRWMRQWLTVLSGASVYAPMYDSVTTPGPDPKMAQDADARKDDRFQFDLINQYNAETQGTERTAEIRDRLTRIFQIGTPKYLGLTDDTKLEQIAAEYAAAIQDYTDSDNEPTEVTVGGKKYYGLEIMPFLREVYFQVAYEAEDTDGDAEKKYDKYQKLRPETAGMIIEIGNPFDKTCYFDEAADGSSPGQRFRVAIKQGDTSVGEWSISAGKQLDPRTSGDEKAEQAIIIVGAQTPTPGTESNKGANMLGDLGAASVYTAIKQWTATTGLLGTIQKNAQPIIIELQVKNKDGNFVTYDRMTVGMLESEYTYTGTKKVGDPATPPVEYVQMTAKRDGQNTRYLSNKNVASGLSSNPPDPTFVLNGAFSKLGSDNKGVTGDQELDWLQIPIANHQMFSPAELGYIFMFGFAEDDTTKEGDFPTRFSNFNYKGEAPSVQLDQVKHRRFLSIPGFPVFSGDGAVPGGIPSHTRISHAAMVFDHFTTLSPRFDGDDNDGDGQADELTATDTPELMVPGRLNVNTAPSFLMALTSALPEKLSENEELYHLIVEYRDRPHKRATLCTGTTGLRDDQFGDLGIASLGELLQLKYKLQTTPVNPLTQGGDHTLLHYGIDNRTGYTAVSASPTTSTGKQNAKRIYPHPDHPTAKVYEPVGGKSFLAQDRMIRWQYLVNTLTTRSDTYCAYVVIRGYNSEDFRTSPSESLRFMVLYDRSSIVNDESEVQVLQWQKN